MQKFVHEVEDPQPEVREVREGGQGEEVLKEHLGEMEGGRKRGRKGGREEEREGGRERGRQGERERERGREGGGERGKIKCKFLFNEPPRHWLCMGHWALNGMQCIWE